MIQVTVPVQRHRGEPGHTRDRHKNLTNQPQNQPHPHCTGSASYFLSQNITHKTSHTSESAYLWEGVNTAAIPLANTCEHVTVLCRDVRSEHAVINAGRVVSACHGARFSLGPVVRAPRCCISGSRG